jgi:hypothetical protein
MTRITLERKCCKPAFEREQLESVADVPSDELHGLVNKIELVGRFAKLKKIGCAFLIIYILGISLMIGGAVFRHHRNKHFHEQFEREINPNFPGEHRPPRPDQPIHFRPHPMQFPPKNDLPEPDAAPPTLNVPGVIPEYPVPTGPESIPQGPVTTLPEQIPQGPIVTSPEQIPQLPITTNRGPIPNMFPPRHQHQNKSPFGRHNGKHFGGRHGRKIQDEHFSNQAAQGENVVPGSTPSMPPKFGNFGRRAHHPGFPHPPRPDDMRRRDHSHLNWKEKEILEIIRSRNELTVPEDLFPLVDEDRVSQPSDFRSFFKNEIISSFDRMEQKKFRDSRGVKFVVNFW